MESATSGRKYLIVDDAPPIRMALKATLDRLGVDDGAMELAATGKEAMDIFGEFEPDVVFMDVQLPGEMSGHEAGLKMLEERPMTKLIVMTGLPPNDPRLHDLRSMGAFFVLHKPFRVASVQEAINLVEEEEAKFGRIL